MPPPGVERARSAAPSRRFLRGSGVERLLAVASFVVFLVGWEVLSRAKVVNPLFFSAPTRIVTAGYDEISAGSIWHDLLVSATEFGVGYFGAFAVAVPFGLLVASYRRVSYFFDPWLNALNSIPRLALLPLVVLWVGLGVWSKIVVVFLGAFFPIAVNTFHGVRTVDTRLLQVATTYSASQARIFRTVVFPATVPFIFAGAQVGVGRAIAGVVVGEFYTAQAGLAYRMFQAGSALKTDILLFYAVVIALLGLAMFRIVGLIERSVAHWRAASGRPGR